jgi:GNAT superfamily N-acetyltransferase
MDLTWVTPASDPREWAGAVAVLEAARAVDAPWEPPMTLSAFRSWATQGWDGDPSCYALASRGGRPIAVLEVGQPRWDNHHVGHLRVTVDPVCRGQGVGRELADLGLDRIRSEGRTLVLTEPDDLPAAVAFCTSLGLERAYRSALRRLDLTALDRNELAGIRAGAAEAAAGYELLRLAGPVPADLLPEIVTLTAMINDAPVDALQVDDEVFSCERIRAFEAAQQHHGRPMYRLVARSRSTGALAGHTVVAVEREHPGHAWQYDTSVARDHRGHRLGLLLKTSMIDWLDTVEPQLRQIDTWNATSNVHMVAVNDVLGCRVLSHASGWQAPLGRADQPSAARTSRICSP